MVALEMNHIRAVRRIVFAVGVFSLLTDLSAASAPAIASVTPPSYHAKV